MNTVIFSDLDLLLPDVSATTAMTREEQPGKRKRTSSSESRDDGIAGTSGNSSGTMEHRVAEEEISGQETWENSVNSEGTSFVDGSDESESRSASDRGESRSEYEAGDKAVIEALRARVRELEAACTTPPPTCRICLVSTLIMFSYVSLIIFPTHCILVFFVSSVKNPLPLSVLY